MKYNLNYELVNTIFFVNEIVYNNFGFQRINNNPICNFRTDNLKGKEYATKQRRRRL